MTLTEANRDHTDGRHPVGFVARALVALAVFPACASQQDVDSIAHSTARPESTERIFLVPVEGEMVCRAIVPAFNKLNFFLGVPEFLADADGSVALDSRLLAGNMIWTEPNEEGSVSVAWEYGTLHFWCRLVPGADYVDLEMTVANAGATTLCGVFCNPCLNPFNSVPFKDLELERTYLSVDGRPLLLSRTKRVARVRPTNLEAASLKPGLACAYLPIGASWEESPRWVWSHWSRSVSPTLTDGSWLVTVSKPPFGYMAVASSDPAFLFDNTDRGCIHSALSFGDLEPGASSTRKKRFFFGLGGLEDFLVRYEQEREELR